ncbi:appr-1-p processing domain-containing protein [mine drainage metagenome]|uniref:Appr-1-p processing domain-containing protein n=1 Tax=mine drainage metagenome TaxID=410659 RepID=T1BIJ5_9ZZZZ
MAIEVVSADITTLAVDAIVNAANESLLGGGGVDGAIHRRAGPEMLAACRRLGGCPTGEVRLTPGFNLPARFVIHAVGPIWQGGASGEGKCLTQVYERILCCAVSQGFQTLAVPCISTGAYGFPKPLASLLALRVLGDYEDRLSRILAVVFDRENEQLYRLRLMSRTPGR